MSNFSEYYATTLMTTAMKVGPPILMIGLGYLVFIKLPFLLMVKKVKNEEDKQDSELPIEKAVPQAPKVEVIKLVHEKKKPKPKQQEEIKKEQKKKASPEEEVFKFEAGQAYSKKELKLRYHELLKLYHPDKVEGLGEEFKEVARIKTQEINKAYERLKKRAS